MSVVAGRGSAHEFYEHVLQGDAEPITVFCAHDAVEFDALADVTD